MSAILRARGNARAPRPRPHQPDLVLGLIDNDVRRWPQLERTTVGAAAGPQVEPVAVPRASDFAALDRLLVERALHVGTKGGVSDQPAVHAHDAECLLAEV